MWVLRCPSSRGNRPNHIIRCKRPSNPLQLELAYWLDFDGIFNRDQHTRADKDLSRLGLVAEPRGYVRDGSDGRIVKTALEADVPSVAKPWAMPMPKPMS